MGQDIVRDDIISFDCTTKLTYKGCEVTARRFGKNLQIQVCNFSGKGYFSEKTDNFIMEIFDNLMDHINKIKPYIEKVYQKTIADNARNNGKIMDIRDY